MSLTSDLSDFENFFQHLERIKWALPEPEGVVEESGRIGAYATIPDSFLVAEHERDEYLQYAWRRLYERLVGKIAKSVLGHDGYIVANFKPVVMPKTTDWDMKMRIGLIADIGYAETRTIVIPEFLYDERGVAHEWKCGHCRLINPIKATVCGEGRAVGCGAPRAKLASEL